MSNLAIKDLVLNEGENVVSVVRQSKLILALSLILPVTLILTPFFLLFFLFSRGNYGIALFFCTLLLGLILLWRVLAVWRYKLLIISSQRLIDVDQKGFFKRTVSNFPFHKIDDVFYKINGLAQTLAKTGNLYVTLNDNKSGLELKNIASPQRVQQLILQLKADTLGDKLNATNLSARELIELVKKIKAGLGEKKFNEILGQSENEDDEENEEDDEADNGGSEDVRTQK